ncbi:hypothetical protein KAI32_00815 [Candidatus Pacearchaeota archaeon]|nr:hypothetical protein [Candidatus Pacearchaeota archaeon]
MKVWRNILIVLAGIIICVFFVRLILPIQLDDVSPGIFCEEELLDLVDVYYVIPKFGNVSIDKNWCDEILKRNKELRLHGVYHSFEEFGKVRDEEYLNEGIEIFEACFGFEPERFKPPQIAWTKENDWMKNEMRIDLGWNEVFHKVYHCGDTGVIPNWVVRVF